MLFKKPILFKSLFNKTEKRELILPPQTDSLKPFYDTFNDVYDFFIDKRTPPLSYRFRSVVRGEGYAYDPPDHASTPYTARISIPYYNRLYLDEYSNHSIYMPLKDTPDTWAGPSVDTYCLNYGYSEMENSAPQYYRDQFKKRFFDFDKELFERKTASFKYDSDKVESDLLAFNNLFDKKDPYKIRIRNISDIIKAEFEMSYYGGVEKGKMIISLCPTNKELLYQYKKLIEKGDRILYTNNQKRQESVTRSTDNGFTLVVENVNFLSETLLEIELVGFRKCFEDVEVEKIMDFNNLGIDTKGIEKIVAVQETFGYKGEFGKNPEIIRLSSFIKKITDEDNPLSKIFSIVKNQNISVKKEEEFKKDSIGDLLDNVCKTANVFLSMNNQVKSISWWWGGDRQVYIGLTKTKNLAMGHDFTTLKSNVDDSKIINSFNFKGKVNIATKRRFIGVDGNDINIPAGGNYQNHVYMTQSFYFNFKIPSIWMRNTPPKDGEYILDVFEEDSSKINYDDRLSQFLYGEHEEVFDIGEISLSKKGIVPNDTISQVENKDRFDIKFPAYIKKKWVGVNSNDLETQGMCPTTRPDGNTYLGAGALGYGYGWGVAGYYMEKESQIRIQIETIVLQHIYDRIRACRFILAKNEHPNLKIELLGQHEIKIPIPHQAFISNVPNVVEYVNVSVNGITGTKGVTTQSRYSAKLHYVEIPQCDTIEIFFNTENKLTLQESPFRVNIVKLDKSNSIPTVKEDSKIPLSPINNISEGGKSLIFDVSSVVDRYVENINPDQKVAPPYSDQPYLATDKYTADNDYVKEIPRKKLDLEIYCNEPFVSPLYIKCITFNKTYPERQIIKRFIPDLPPGSNGKYGNINYMNREIVNYVSNGLPCQSMKLKYTGISSFTSDSAKYAETPEQLLEDILIYNKIQPK